MSGTVMDLLVVADQILILVLLIAVGYAAVSTKIMDPRATRGLSALLVNVTIPALIIASMQVPFTPERLAGAEILLLATGVLFAFSFALAWAVSKAMQVPPAEEGVLQFAIVFGNVGFMGFPVARATGNPMKLTLPKTIANSKTPLFWGATAIVRDAIRATTNERAKKAPVARSIVPVSARRSEVKGTCMAETISAGMVMLKRRAESPRVAPGSMIFVETAT